MKSHNVVRNGLSELGHEITYDWTTHGSVKTVSKERLGEVAIDELEGVVQADLVVVLLPGGGGTHVELGYSLAKGKRVFLHTNDPLLFELGPQTNAFYHHPDLTQLTCPLNELAVNINSLLLPAAIL